ncbi:MAG: hypothetical protein OK455_02055 [Thaumarchaeota archaeon]|nr:hypothetical protein [Nitrososphaerota archaeon]
MNPAKRGLTTGGKLGIVVILVILVLGGAYFAPSLMTGGTHSSSSSSRSAGSSSIPLAGNQTLGLLSLFGYFSQMQMQAATYDNSEGNALVEQHTVSYVVLGKASLNSTQYTKVQFSQTGSSNPIIAWFNSSGGINRVDLIGVGNYTGTSASVYAQLYVSAFSLITGLSSNATIFSILSKTSENTTSIGPTKLDVVSYALAAPTPPYTSITARYATIPGTNTRLAVYLDEKTSDLMESVVQVLSLTK